MPANSGPAPMRQQYSRDEVRRMLNVSERLLRSWEQQGLVQLSGTFGFKELLALRALKKLSREGHPAKKIARMLDAIRTKLTSVDEPLTQLRITSRGKRIDVQVAGQRMEAMSGQLLFDFDASGEGGQVKPMLARKEAPAEVDFSSAEEWFQRGLHLEEQGALPKEAAEAYRKATEINPNAAGALVNLGTISFRARNLREAAVYYKRAIEADPKYALAHFNLGNVFDEMGQMEEAVKHYQVALQLNPRYGDAHFNMALIAERQGDTLHAVKHWRAYLDIDPASSWASQARQQLARLRRLTVVE